MPSIYIGFLNKSFPFLFCNFSLFSSKKSTNSRTPPSNLNSEIFSFFWLESVNIILIPLFLLIGILIKQNPIYFNKKGSERFLIRELFKDVYEIDKPGHIEGGDILVTGKEILVGRSARTNANGVRQLSEIVTPLGYVMREVFTPPEILHFKTDCSLLGPDEILSTKRLQDSGCFDGYKVVNVADGEEAAANAIRVNDYVIMPGGFPQTKAILEDRGYKIKIINNTECAKLDGGMSCLSLRLNLM